MEDSSSSSNGSDLEDYLFDDDAEKMPVLLAAKELDEKKKERC
jgi:hypothetical protein